jgi:hypothetical protein
MANYILKERRSSGYKRSKEKGVQEVLKIQKKKKIQDYTTQKTTWSPNEVTKKQAHNPPNPPRFRFTTT